MVADDRRRLLMEALMTSRLGVTDTNLQALLGEYGDDPTVNAIRQILELRQDEESLAEDSATVEARRTSDSFDYDRPDTYGRSDMRASSKERILSRIDALRDEVQLLRTRNDELAAALGACYLCWGENAECSVCAGRGVFGSVTPDPVLFARIATPAVRAIQASRDLERTRGAGRAFPNARKEGMNDGVSDSRERS